MKLNAPKVITWLIALILAVLSVLGAHFVTIPFVTVYAYWIMFAAWALLCLGTFFKGL